MIFANHVDEMEQSNNAQPIVLEDQHRPLFHQTVIPFQELSQKITLPSR